MPLAHTESQSITLIITNDGSESYCSSVTPPLTPHPSPPLARQLAGGGKGVEEWGAEAAGRTQKQTADGKRGRAGVGGADVHALHSSSPQPPFYLYIIPPLPPPPSSLFCNYRDVVPLSIPTRARPECKSYRNLRSDPLSLPPPGRRRPHCVSANPITVHPLRKPRTEA